MTQTGQKDTSYTPNPAVAQSALQGLGAASTLMTQGFPGYSGQMVANMSPQQRSSLGIANSVASGGVPYIDQSKNLINQYSGAPASSVGASPIWSQMSPYMNQYVQQALAPQLELQNQQFAQQDQANNAAATSSGAFGDARAGIQTANTSLAQDLARQGLIGTAYTSAFNTAIGAGAQDVSNSLNAQTTNANLNETALNRALGGAQALQGLGGYQIGQGTNLFNLQNTAGQQATAQQQAQLNAQYQQYLLGLQYPFQGLQAFNQTVGTAAGAMPASSSQSTSAPNNAGWAVGGALLGTALGGPVGGSIGSTIGANLAGFGGNTSTGLSDREWKEDIVRIGELLDKTPVYSFKYKGDPSRATRVGVMAQDIEKINPDAVVVPFRGGPKFVDYDKATANARWLGQAEAA